MINSSTYRRIIRYKLMLPVVLVVFASLFLVMVSQSLTISRVPINYVRRGLRRRFAKVKNYQFPWTKPNVEWQAISPENNGINLSNLDALAERLSDHGTKAFLVAKDDHIVYEEYWGGGNANAKHYTAALTKAITGSMALMIAINDGLIRLDDPAWKYIPMWKNDYLRSKITIEQLGSHTSGLDDVRFADDVSPEWKRTYYHNREMRFPLALSKTSVISEPGARYSYSGVGYYALAYAITKSLQGNPDSDILTLLESHIMSALGIPPEAWDISYGEHYELNGMKLYAAGSGGNYTPRAVARIGQFMLNKGEWDGKQLVKPKVVQDILTQSNPEANPDVPTASNGWYTNTNGYFPSLPLDAFWGSGAGNQILLVVPSLNLVMVRMGDTISTDNSKDSMHKDQLEEFLFSPLMQSVK